MNSSTARDYLAKLERVASVTSVQCQMPFGDKFR